MTFLEYAKQAFLQVKKTHIYELQLVQNIAKLFHSTYSKYMIFYMYFLKHLFGIKCIIINNNTGLIIVNNDYRYIPGYNKASQYPQC